LADAEADEGGCSGDENEAEGRFGLREYARLLAVLTREEDVKAALVESGLSRTREHQDCRIPRDAFWASLVEKRFNDADYRPIVDLRGVVDDVHAEKCPS